jgi:serine/threonine-protein kinase
VALRRETGVLLVERGAARKKIYLVDGKIEFASSTEPGELIGARLVHENLILPVELDMALAVAPRFGGRVGDALVGLGILRPVDVFRGVVEQMRARVVDVLRWREGTITFVRGVRSHEEAPPVPLGPFELLARSVREAYEDDEISAILAPLLGKAPQPGERGALPPISLGLPDVEGEVLLAVDGTVTVSDLLRDQATRLGLSRRDVARAIFIGLSARTIAIEDWPPDMSTAKTQPGRKA